MKKAKIEIMYLMSTKEAPIQTKKCYWCMNKRNVISNQNRRTKQAKIQPKRCLFKQINATDA